MVLLLDLRGQLLYLLLELSIFLWKKLVLAKSLLQLSIQIFNSLEELLDLQSFQFWTLSFEVKQIALLEVLSVLRKGFGGFLLYDLWR